MTDEYFSKEMYIIAEAIKTHAKTRSEWTQSDSVYAGKLILLLNELMIEWEGGRGWEIDK